MIRQTRLLIAAYISLDILLAMLAFSLAYLVRFETGFFSAPKGQPPFEQYLTLMPFIGLLVKNDDAESFADAIQIVIQQKFDPVRLHAAAARFSPEVFYKNMRTALEALAYNHT